MQYKITYPMEAERYILAVLEESGGERDAVTEKLAIAITAKINKAYYRGKFGRGERPDVDEKIARVQRSLERGAIDPVGAKFYTGMYRNEAAAFDAGQRVRAKARAEQWQ